MSFADIVKETQEIIGQAKKKAEKAFLAELKEVFDRHPEIKMFRWNQYTPYFNDGDTCEFNVHDIYFSNYEISGWGDFEETDEHSDAPADFFCHNLGSSGQKSQFPDLTALATFMNSNTGEEILQFMFGDHVTVKVTKDGAESDEYDHD